MKMVFGKSREWVRVPDVGNDPDGDGPVLERLVFRHRAGAAVLVADAYRGREIKTCLEEVYRGLSGETTVRFSEKTGAVAEGKPADLVVFVGHNGLMDFSIPLPKVSSNANGPRAAMIFCCKSADYFGPVLAKSGVTPFILTQQLMYPASQLVHEGVAGWIAGESAGACSSRAARAYAKNQKISVKAAAGVFTTVPKH